MSQRRQQLQKEVVQQTPWKARHVHPGSLNLAFTQTLALELKTTVPNKIKIFRRVRKLKSNPQQIRKSPRRLAVGVQEELLPP